MPKTPSPRPVTGFVANLTVSDIATYRLLACDVHDDAAEVLDREELHAFDCIPVRRDGQIVGVLLRDGSQQEARVDEVMRPLDETLLVSSSAPLKEFIPLLADQPQRLVVRGARVEGIVTRSDMHKLPVRVLTFALVTQLELTMASAIRRAYDDETWLQALSAGRRSRLLEKHAALRSARVEPSLLELTDFCDKREALAKVGLLATPSKSRAVKEFERIEELRDSVVHAAAYAVTEEQFRDFVALLALIEEWIGRLSRAPADRRLLSADARGHLDASRDEGFSGAGIRVRADGPGGCRGKAPTPMTRR